MSEFFEPPPLPPEPRKAQRWRSPPWIHAPRGSLPGSLALDLVLARTAKVAVCVTRLEAYPEGFGLQLLTMSAADLDELDPLLFEGHRMRARGAREGIPDEMLRFGVEFSDGSRATNTGGRPLANLQGGHSSTMHAIDRSRPPQPPDGPVLNTGGGGGGGGHWQQEIWVWPLPPPGPLAFVCQWPAAGIELTRREVDAGLLIDAAARAEVVFAEQDEPDERADEPPDDIAAE